MFYQSLVSADTYKRQSGSLREIKRCRFGCQLASLNRRVFSKRTVAAQRAGLPVYCFACLYYSAGEVAAKCSRKIKFGHLSGTAFADGYVERVDARRMDLHQQLAFCRARFGDIGRDLHHILTAVSVDLCSLHYYT